MANPLPVLTPTQQAYLQALRDGSLDGSQLVIRPGLTQDNSNDFDNFKEFLHENGHPGPEAADLFLTVTRQDFLRILYYAADRNRQCLILQSCFGFDAAPTTNVTNADDVSPRLPVTQQVTGRVVLINKGNLQELEGRSDEELLFGDTVFRNGNGRIEYFLNLNLDHPLSAQEAQQFTNNFAALYPINDDPTVPDDPFILGFLLPVKPLIHLFTDPANPFGFSSTNMITLRWGLTAFVGGRRLGNFSLCIGTVDLSAGSIIEFRNPDITGAGDNDCPPKTGCPKPPGRG